MNGINNAWRCSRRTSIAIALVLLSSQAARAQSCAGDLDGDGAVNGADLGGVLNGWGPCDSCGADLNADGIVDGADLGVVLGAWGECPVVVPGWATLVEARPDPAVVTDPALRAAIVATGLPWRVRDAATQIEMLLVPAGTFRMGCIVPSDEHTCLSWEQPVHQVTLTDPYYVGRYEVTQAQWQATMGSNPSRFRNPSPQVPAAEVPGRPVERVSWTAVQSFLAATGLRLPTEAEWEHACRAGTQAPFHNGSTDDGTLGSLAWSSSSSGSQTRPVGGVSANALGLHDMLGNVWEWVDDRYGDYPLEPQVNPTGPSNAPYRTLRGGSWVSDPFHVRSSGRSFEWPGVAFDDIGFRAARSP